MAVVAPVATATHPRSNRLHRTTRSIFRWVYALVIRLPGRYSISKLASFEEFQQRHSSRHVAAILALTPIPCLLVNLLLEAIPLADPVKGYSHSIAFQVRYFIASALQNILPAMVKKDCVPDFPTGSWIMIIAFGLVQALVGVSTNAIISAANGVFPVPFTQFTPIVPMTIVGSLICYRRQALGPEVANFRSKSTQVDNRLGMELLPMVVYPTFSAIFMALSPLGQLYLSLMLPVIKLAMRRWLWLVTKNDEDLVGVITCCVGHYYHLLFTGVLFQNAKSYEVMAAISIFNVVQMATNCRTIVQEATSLDNARNELEKDFARTMPTNVVSSALHFAHQDDVAVKLHAQHPSALLSTYPGYHGKSFMIRHRNLFRGISPTLHPPPAPIQSNSEAKAGESGK